MRSLINDGVASFARKSGSSFCAECRNQCYRTQADGSAVGYDRKAAGLGLERRII